MVDIDIFRTDVSKGDKILLCSDGLYGFVSDEQISALLTKELDGAVHALVALANENGGRDNITVAAAEIN